MKRVPQWRLAAAAFSLVLMCCGCSKTDNALVGERILNDEELFDSKVVESVTRGRQICIERLQTKYSRENLPPGTDTMASGSMIVVIAEDRQPKLADIVTKYGPPERVEGSVRYYGDIGFKVQNAQDGRVDQVIVRCSIHAVATEDS